MLSLHGGFGYWYTTRTSESIHTIAFSIVANAAAIAVVGA
jgi:hypothetical protein